MYIMISKEKAGNWLYSSIAFPKLNSDFII